VFYVIPVFEYSGRVPRVAPAVALNAVTERLLEHLVRAPSTPQALALRGRIVLAAGRGHTNQEIAETLGIPEVTAGKWRRAFVADGIDGLRDAPRSGRPPKHGSDVWQRIQTRACEQPAHYSRWTVRTLARDLQLPPATVHEVLKTSGLQLHRLRTFTFSPDPDFEANLLDIVGLYLHPPEHALVLCVDEKTGIQALDRTQPGLPLRAQRPRTWTNEYIRHGTQALLAALEVATGRVIGHVRDRRTSANFLHFMDDVVAAFPQRDVHVILDNLNIHKNAAAQRWLARHPRVQFHHTPTHASWVNLIEVFFSILGKQGLAHRVDRSKRSLKGFLLEYLEQYNATCAPFTWTKGPDKLQHIIETTAAAHTTGQIPKRPRRRRRRPANNIKH
jgi:transposase